MQLVIVHYAVRQNRFICLLGDDFAHQDAGLVTVAHTFAFKRHRELFDDRGVDMGTLVDMAASFLNLVDLAASLHAEVISNFHRVLGGKGHGEGLGMLDVLRGFVLGQEQCDFIIIRLCSPSSIHGIGNAVLIIGANDEYPLRGDAGFLASKFHAHADSSLIIVNYHTGIIFFANADNPAM